MSKAEDQLTEAKPAKHKDDLEIIEGRKSDVLTQWLSSDEEEEKEIIGMYRSRLMPMIETFEEAKRDRNPARFLAREAVGFLGKVRMKELVRMPNPEQAVKDIRKCLRHAVKYMKP